MRNPLKIKRKWITMETFLTNMDTDIDKKDYIITYEWFWYKLSDWFYQTFTRNWCDICKKYVWIFQKKTKVYEEWEDEKDLSSYVYKHKKCVNKNE